MYAVAGVALTSMMILTVADVVLRSLRRPIVGTYELVGLLGAVVVGFSIPQTSRLRGHVYMDFLTGKLTRVPARILKAITRLLGIAIFSIIAWNLWLMGNDFRASQEVSLTLQVPLHYVPYGVAVCCVVECLVLFVDMLTPPKTGADS
jgi:TRAP-type C4-dicarboxylate transport system permease small subunit